MTDRPPGPAGPDESREYPGLISLVAKRDFLRTVKRRGFVIGTALLPLGIAAMLFLSTFVSSGLADDGGPPDDFDLFVANESSLALEPLPEVAPHLQLVSRQDGLASLESGEADELYVIPSTYPTDPTIVRVGSEANQGLELGSLSRQQAQQQELAAFLSSSLLLDANVPPDVASRIATPYQLTNVTPSGEPVTGEPSIASFLLPFAFTLVFVLSIFITSGYLLQSVTEEKENRVVEIVLSSVPALPLMAGKILGLGAAGLTQVAAWIITAVIAVPLLGGAGVDVSSIELDPLMLLLGLVYFILGYLAYGAIFSAIGALAPGSREAQQYSGFFGFFAVIPLIFSGIFLTDPSSPIVTILALVPFTAPAAMLFLLTVSTEPPWPLIIGSLISLSVFTVIATVASARIFRATLLLYGVRPSVKNIAAAVFARG